MMNLSLPSFKTFKTVSLAGLIFLGFQLVSPLASAQDAATAAPSAAASEEDLRKSFQREYVYLASQKEALTKQKQRLEQNLNQRIASAKAQTASLQKEGVRLASENDENHEYMMTLEKRKKDLQKRDSSMESIYKKASKTLTEFEAGLKFEATPAKTDVVVPEDLKFADFDTLMSKTSDLLTAAASVESFDSSFVDMNDKLVEGTVTRFGRSAAIGTTKEGHFILGPNGDGMLRALEVSKAPTTPSLNLFVFESLSKMAKVKKPAGVMERLADLSPILFLGVMLLLVLGLFSSLIKV